jgi:hypothetical protein
MLIAILVQRKGEILQDGVELAGKTKYALDFTGKCVNQLGAQISHRRNQDDMFGFRVQRFWVLGLGFWVHRFIGSGFQINLGFWILEFGFKVRLRRFN